jgi:ribosomal subunit interface protein
MIGANGTGGAPVGRASEARAVRVTVVARHPVPDDVRRYADQKLRRLSRHGNVLEASLVLDHEARRIPGASAELVVHLHHIRLSSRVEGGSLREAIDKVVDRGNRQVLRRKERVTERKGRVGADGLGASPGLS